MFMVRSSSDSLEASPELNTTQSAIDFLKEANKANLFGPFNSRDIELGRLQRLKTHNIVNLGKKTTECQETRNELNMKEPMEEDDSLVLEQSNLFLNSDCSIPKEAEHLEESCGRGKKMETYANLWKSLQLAKVRGRGRLTVVEKEKLDLDRNNSLKMDRNYQYGNKRNAPMDLFSNNTPMDSFSSNTPMDSFSNNTPMDSFSSNTPVDSFTNKTPMDSFSSNKFIKTFWETSLDDKQVSDNAGLLSNSSEACSAEQFVDAECCTTNSDNTSTHFTHHPQTQSCSEAWLVSTTTRTPVMSSPTKNDIQTNKRHDFVKNRRSRLAACFPSVGLNNEDPNPDK